VKRFIAAARTTSCARLVLSSGLLENASEPSRPRIPGRVWGEFGGKGAWYPGERL
jgi:hypothetical protein